MKALRLLKHAALVIVALILLAGIPATANFDLFSASDDTADAVASASLQLPDQPSGEFLVLLNRSLHEDTLSDWESFFTDSDFVVIFEDIQCIVAEGDASGQQLAERFQAQLPENQMTVRSENPTLLVSKAEAGYADVIIFSQEMADALQLADTLPDSMYIIRISGGEENEKT